MTAPLPFAPHQMWGACAALFALALAIILVARQVDARTLSGDSVWAKPMKFALSLAVHFGTFAVIAWGLPAAMQASAWLRLTAWASIAAGLFEIGYISLQAARGRHSHFNTGTPFETAMALLMGVGALLILVPGFVIGILVLIGPVPAWPWSLRFGVGAGLLVGEGLTLTTGMAMGAAASHFAKVPPASSRRMRLTGWSLDGGDLRPAHFLAAHMMQGAPLAALLASRSLPEGIALAVVGAVSLGWVVATLRASAWATTGRKLPGLFSLGATPRSSGKPILDAHPAA